MRTMLVFTLSSKRWAVRAAVRHQPRLAKRFPGRFSK